LQILKGTPERAEVVPVKPRDIRRKLFDKNLRSQDRDMNVVSIKDIVRVSEGHYKGKEGPIEHIHRGILFIHDRRHLENGGFLCVRARACLALGGSHRGFERPKFGATLSNGLNSSVNVLQSPRRDTPYAPTGNFPRGRGGFRRDDGVVGRTVKVRMGPFKGYRGRVVDATDSTVRIELESQMKVVTGASDPSVGHQLDSFLLLWMLRLRLTIEIAVACCGFNNLCIMATHNHLMVLVVCS
jgi:transcription elongation factor SPT5